MAPAWASFNIGLCVLWASCVCLCLLWTVAERAKAYYRFSDYAVYCAVHTGKDSFGHLFVLFIEVQCRLLKYLVVALEPLMVASLWASFCVLHRLLVFEWCSSDWLALALAAACLRARALDLHMSTDCGCRLVSVLAAMALDANFVVVIGVFIWPSFMRKRPASASLGSGKKMASSSNVSQPSQRISKRQKLSHDKGANGECWSCLAGGFGIYSSQARRGVGRNCCRSCFGGRFSKHAILSIMTWVLLGVLSVKSMLHCGVQLATMFKI